MNYNANIVKKAGELVPEEAIKKVLQPMKGWKLSASGFAIQAVVDGKPHLVVETDTDIPSFEKFMEVQEAAKDFNAIFSFSSGEFTKEGIQPFHLAIGDDSATQVILVAAFDGDFPRFNTTANEPFHLFQDHITPALEQAITSHGGLDFEKLREWLTHKSFFNNLSLATGHRGEFIFMLPEGDPIRLLKDNKLGGEYEWGSMSQTCGFGETVAVAPKKANFLDKFTFKKPTGEVAAPAATPAPAPAPEKVPETPETPAPKVEPKKEMHPSEGDANGKFFNVPTEKSMKNKKKWYTSITGNPVPSNVDLEVERLYIPFSAFVENKRPKPAVQIASTTPVKVVKDFKDLKTQTSAADVNAKKVTLTAPERAKEVNVMVLSKDEKSKGSDFILKDLDANSNVIAGSVAEIQQIEEKYPRMSEEMGIPLTDIFFWKPEKLSEMISKYPKIALGFFIEQRRELMSHYTLADLTKLAPKAVDATPAPAEKVAAPAATENKFGFHFKKTA